MTSGIYAIINTVTNDEYIGASTDIAIRWRAHLADLKGGRHHSKGLQNAYNTVGASALRLVILEDVGTPRLDILYGYEDRYIQERNPAYNSANVSHTPRSIRVGMSLPPHVASAIDVISDGMRTAYLRELVIKAFESGLPKLDLSTYVNDPKYGLKQKQLRDDTDTEGTERW